MAYTVDCFATLVQKYPSWDSFHAYMTSPDGGQMRCVGEGRYRILRYVKGVSDLKTSHGKWFRSVVWDTQEHVPVCVAPPKAESGDIPTGDAFPLVETFLDGTMINVFRTLDNPGILVSATRTQIGAGGTFYSEKTFDQLFEEALHAMGSSKEEVLSLLAQPTEMVPNHFASFVLQHPEHRVVSRCSRPRVWLVHTGSVHDDGLVSFNEDPHHWPNRFRLPHATLDVSSDARVSSSFADLCKTNGWFFQGIVVRNGKGSRWRLRNPNYLYLRSLRGSEATPLERFLRLRSESKVSEYLKHYTEERQVFWDFEQALRKATKDVYDAYCSVHKSHEKKLEDLPFAIKPCVFKLHAHYLEHLRPNSEKVQWKHAVELVNNLQLFEQKRLLTAPSEMSAKGPLVTMAAGLAEAAAPVST